MRLTLPLSAAVFLWSTLVGASNVIDLDSDNFDTYVGGKRGALVEFFAPWCGHCKNLAPTYEQLADAFPSDKVVIAKTDADGVGKDLGNRYGVTGFPTLKWFPPGSSEPVDYTSGRDIDSLASFVSEQSGVKSKIKPPPPPGYAQLSIDNFDSIALDENKDVLVAFTASWCGHCKSMKPAYDKAARAFSSEPDVVMAQVENSDKPENAPLAEKYGVSSYPTIVFFPRGGAPYEKYTGGRSEEAFVAFMNEHSGSFRTPSGGLTDLAGKVLPLDQLASDFFTSAVPERSDVLAQAKKVLADLTASKDAVSKKANASAGYYVKAMERMIEKGEGWLVKEQARIAGLLGSPSLAPTKLDELKIKANILSSFALKKVEEVYDDAAQVVMDGAEEIKKAGQKVAEKAAEATDRVKAEL